VAEFNFFLNYVSRHVFSCWVLTFLRYTGIHFRSRLIGFFSNTRDRLLRFTKHRFYHQFLPRCSYAAAVLRWAMSVFLSVKCVNCDKTKETSAHFLYCMKGRCL